MLGDSEYGFVAQMRRSGLCECSFIVPVRITCDVFLCFCGLLSEIECMHAFIHSFITKDVVTICHCLSETTQVRILVTAEMLWYL